MWERHTVGSQSTAMIGELQQTDKEIEEGEFNVNNITSLNNIFTFRNTDGGIVDLYTSYSKPVIYITVHACCNYVASYVKNSGLATKQKHLNGHVSRLYF